MALELGLPGEPLAEGIRRAAEATGGELVLALPGPDGQASAVVRLLDGGSTFFLEVRTEKNGRLVVVGEEEIDGALLDFARAAIELMERLKADKANVDLPSADAT